MTTVPDRSAAYAAEVARLLWPEPWEPPQLVRGRAGGPRAHRDAYVFPSRRRPRILVPTDVPQSSAMLRRLGTGRAPLSGAVHGLLERSVRSRAFALARWPVLRVAASDPGADCVESWLAARLGVPVRAGVLLGTRRANQKPVLQLFGPDGDLLGYAKVGHTEQTADLVRREALALQTVGALRPQAFGVPEVLVHGRWSGLEVLAVSALRTVPGRAVGRGTLAAAVRELATLGGTRGARLAASAFWSRLRHSADALPAGPDADALRTGLQTLEARHGGDLVELGAWHGDWGRWNMGLDDRGVLQVWDWERYDAQVPVGFDAVHHAVQLLRPGKRDGGRHEDALLAALPTVLRQVGVATHRHALTLDLYLAEIALRYLEAAQGGATAPLRRRTTWVLDLLARRLATTPPAHRSEGPS